MKNTLKYLALMGFASLAMTGCPAAETTCETAEDCLDGEICSEDGVCEAEDTTCESNTDCTVEGEVCLPTAADETVSECAAPTNCAEAADGAAYCTAELGVDATCNTDVDTAPVCEATPTSETRYVQILDASEGGSCDSTSGTGDANADPGSDIMYVQALSADGELLGYGKFVDFTEGTNDNDAANGYNKPAEVFTGDAPELGADQCPVETPAGSGNKFRSDSVVSMGCGGSLVVEFTDKDDITAILALAAGQQIDVGEFGPYCTNPDSGEGSDKYSVYLCDTTIGADPSTIDFDTECLIELGTDAQGQEAFDVPAPSAD